MNQGIPILVVDDQAGMRLTLKGLLSKRGYQVTVAESGEEALKAVQKESFRVIFMDIKMPGMSGVDAFIKIKEMNTGATVIMMTAFAVEDEIRRAIREGAYAVAHKPFDMQRIFSIIEECLEKKVLILVVDGLPESRKELKKTLEEKGHKVVEAESGEECLKCIRERRFQIILLDHQLPGMPGLETLKEIKNTRPDTAVIYITAQTEEHMVEEAINESSIAYLNKPFDVEKLLNVVDRCLAGEGAN